MSALDEIVAANPGVDIWLPGVGTTVRLLMQHLLPSQRRCIKTGWSDGDPLQRCQKKRRGRCRGAPTYRRRSNYFETDFLNMRSIFSLICSIACEFC
jgi:hypothetical protein